MAGDDEGGGGCAGTRITDKADCMPGIPVTTGLGIQFSSL